MSNDPRDLISSAIALSNRIESAAMDDDHAKVERDCLFAAASSCDVVVARLQTAITYRRLRKGLRQIEDDPPDLPTNTAVDQMGES